MTVTETIVYQAIARGHTRENAYRIADLCEIVHNATADTTATAERALAEIREINGSLAGLTRGLTMTDHVVRLEPYGHAEWVCEVRNTRGQLITGYGDNPDEALAAARAERERLDREDERARRELPDDGGATYAAGYAYAAGYPD